MAKIYTKNGDKGNTSLFMGGTISKSDIRVDAYGTVDEVVSTLGFAKTQCKESKVLEILDKLQHSLFKIGAELSVNKVKSRKKPEDIINTIDEGNITEVENNIDSILKKIDIGNEFIMPGTSSGSASLDIARTVIRRLERSIVKLNEEIGIENKNIIIYVNRMSDLLFVLARLEDRKKNTKKIRGIRKKKND
ncbi:MAG: ATP:cob(I)alamin adenosyltransferase [Chloroflexi bacterium]|nr:ATP:cob(I)alamin adenosyltransferase [Chloroflexota bacterium]